MTGFTASTNFPKLNPIPTQTNLHGTPHPSLGVYPPDAFVAKLYSTGTLAFATFLGGSTNDVAIGIAVNAARDIFVTGYTRSSDFPTTNALYGTLQNSDDVFVTKLTSASNSYAFVYSTYLGGTNTDHGEGIAADDAGIAYVTGYTSSTNYPITTNANTAFQRFLNNPETNATNHVVGAVVARDAFVTLLSPMVRPQSSPLSSAASSPMKVIASLSMAGTTSHICGASSSRNFPFTSTLTRDATNAGSFADAFVTKYRFDGSTNVYSALFGGTNVDQAWDVAVDANGQAHVVGVSYSTSLPDHQHAGVLARHQLWFCRRVRVRAGQQRQLVRPLRACGRQAQRFRLRHRNGCRGRRLHRRHDPFDRLPQPRSIRQQIFRRQRRLLREDQQRTH